MPEIISGSRSFRQFEITFIPNLYTTLQRPIRRNFEIDSDFCFLGGKGHISMIERRRNRVSLENGKNSCKNIIAYRVPNFLEKERVYFVSGQLEPYAYELGHDRLLRKYKACRKQHLSLSRLKVGHNLTHCPCH